MAVNWPSDFQVPISCCGDISVDIDDFIKAFDYSTSSEDIPSLYASSRSSFLRDSRQLCARLDQLPKRFLDSFVCEAFHSANKEALTLLLSHWRYDEFVLWKFLYSVITVEEYDILNSKLEDSHAALRSAVIDTLKSTGSLIKYLDLRTAPNLVTDNSKIDYELLNNFCYDLLSTSSGKVDNCLEVVCCATYGSFGKLLELGFNNKVKFVISVASFDILSYLFELSGDKTHEMKLNWKFYEDLEVRLFTSHICQSGKISVSEKHHKEVVKWIASYVTSVSIVVNDCPPTSSTYKRRDHTSVKLSELLSPLDKLETVTLQVTGFDTCGLLSELELVLKQRKCHVKLIFYSIFYDRVDLLESTRLKCLPYLTDNLFSLELNGMRIHVEDSPPLPSIFLDDLCLPNLVKIEIDYNPFCLEEFNLLVDAVKEKCPLLKLLMVTEQADASVTLGTFFMRRDVKHPDVSADNTCELVERRLTYVKESAHPSMKLLGLDITDCLNCILTKSQRTTCSFCQTLMTYSVPIGRKLVILLK